MARTKEQIQAQMEAAVQADSILAPLLYSSNPLAVFRRFISIVATAVYLFELVFDKFKADIESALTSMKPHSLSWYVLKAKSFQYGYSLPPFADEYDNSSLSSTQIQSSKIVVQASCSKATRPNGTTYLLMKIAKRGQPLAKLSTQELAAFTSYMDSIQDAGVDLQVVSEDADNMTAHWVAYYDPQQIDALGNSIIDGSPVIENAIKAYLAELPFDGQYVPSHHEQYVLDNVVGVSIARIDSVEITPYGSNTTVAPGIGGMKPRAGWVNVDSLTITLIANE